ncbi:hypothetical protein E2C01_026143 [Portunus trituberculatus]|uniref:Uncharacterized protein n=1 Tax=Portunus trituberculatus TaxID=210409 RepID=A0A5B7EID1_PORTR|nr:hypothetical protein [Portunus trituberculatus]
MSCGTRRHAPHSSVVTRRLPLPSRTGAGDVAENVRKVEVPGGDATRELSVMWHELPWGGAGRVLLREPRSPACHPRVPPIL